MRKDTNLWIILRESQIRNLFQTISNTTFKSIMIRALMIKDSDMCGLILLKKIKTNSLSNNTQMQHQLIGNNGFILQDIFQKIFKETFL